MPQSPYDGLLRTTKRNKKRNPQAGAHRTLPGEGNFIAPPHQIVLNLKAKGAINVPRTQLKEIGDTKTLFCTVKRLSFSLSLSYVPLAFL